MLVFRVLYVDDDPVLLEIGKLYLEQEGQFCVDIITSAPAALDLLRTTKYDAIISDYQMPEMDGIGFLKEVRKAGDTTPFILFTGRGREEVVIQALNEGADFYLQKGGDPKPQFAELSHKIRQAVQRREAEIRIRNHERREAGILNFLPDATFAIDTGGVVIAWNRAMERMTGLPASFMLGKGNYEYALPFYHERRPILIDLVLNDNPADAARYPYIRRDGSILYSEITLPFLNNKKDVALWFTASPLYGDRGAVIGAIESIRDITSRRKAEAALVESEGRYRNVVEDQTEFISRFLPDGTHMFVNEAYCRYFGKAREEIIGKKFMPSIPGDESRLVRDHFSSLTKDNPTAIIEHRIIMPDGSVRWQRWSDRAIFSDAGELLEYQSVGRDVTEIKRAEEEQKKSAATLASIFRAAPVGIGLVSDRVLMRVNDRLCEMTGYSRDELVGKSARVLYPDDAAFEYVGKEKYDQIRTKGTGTVETQWKFADGSLHTILLSSTPLDPSDLKAGVTFTALDITERTLAEKALKESEEKYRMIADNTADNIWIFGMDFRLRYINPSVQKMKGFTPDEAMAQSVDQMLTPASLATVLKRFEEEMALEATGTADPDRTVSFESEEYCRDGSTIQVENTAVLLRDEHRQPVAILGISRDISQRRKVEEALRESEDRYRKLVEILPDAVFLHRQGKIVYMNPAAARLLGVPDTDALLGREILDFVHPRCRDQVRSSISKDLSGEITPRMELRMIRADGSPVEVEGRGVQTFIGGAPAILVAVSDVTERRRADEALRESGELFGEVLKNANDAIFLLERNPSGPGQYLLVNDKAVRMLGYSREELLKMTPRDIVPEEIQKRVMPGIIRKLVREGQATFESVHRRRDGSTYPVEVSTHTFRYKGRDVDLSICRDITDRKRAEEILRESEEKYRTLADNLPDYVLIHRNGTILYANQACADVTGMKVQDLIGKSVFLFIAPESRDRVFESIRADAPEKRTYEAEILVKNGVRRHGLISSTTIPFAGEPASLAVVSDITERKQAEDALRAANRQLTLMTGITRHDISNQIQAMLGYLDLAKKKSHDPSMASFVGRLESAVRNIRSHIDFTRVYQNVGSQAPQWLEPDLLLQHQPVPAGVTLVSSLQGLEILADPMLEKVFANLLDNAIRHGRHATEIRVSSGRNGSGMVLVFEDNGAGVPPDQKERIFERGVGKHTGLGLFLVREILSLTGIRIRETGEPGKGARFELTVPAGAWRVREAGAGRV